jgi:hypothetical protein
LYIDDQLFVANDDNFQVVEDFALPIIEGTGDTTFALGACWHGKLNLVSIFIMYENLSELNPRMNIEINYYKFRSSIAYGSTFSWSIIRSFY